MAILPELTTSYWVASTTDPQLAPARHVPAVDVVVLGAGIAGLTAAYLCASQDVLSPSSRQRLLATPLAEES